MNAEHIVLGIVDACDGRLEGRTYLQKMGSFVSKALATLIGYRPHYYGPYSRLVAAEIDSAVARGILSERREEFRSHFPPAGQFEHVRYTYQLTDAGREYINALKRRDDEDFSRVARIVHRIRETGADYRQLSCAAKVDHLLAVAGGKITRRRAKAEARELGWHLSDGDIETAVDVLEELGIAKRTANRRTRRKSR